MSLPLQLASLTETVGKKMQSCDCHAFGILFVMGYIMIVPLGVSHLLCLLCGVVSYVLLLPPDHQPSAKVLDPDQEDSVTEAREASDAVTSQQLTEQHGAAARSGPEVPVQASTAQTASAQAATRATTMAAQQKWRHPTTGAAPGVDRANADDNWRSRRPPPPWESKRQRAPGAAKDPNEKIALSAGLSAARRVLAKEAA